MSNNKQSSVEWLKTEVLKTVMFETEKDEEHFLKLFEQAKAMHKEEIMQAVYDSMGNNFDPNMGRAEQYYNETFKQD